MRILREDERVAVPRLVSVNVFHVGSPGYVGEGTEALPVAALYEDQGAFPFC